MVQQMLTPKSNESAIVISSLDMTWQSKTIFNDRNKTIICEASKDAPIIIIGIG